MKSGKVVVKIQIKDNLTSLLNVLRVLAAIQWLMNNVSRETKEDSNG